MKETLSTRTPLHCNALLPISADTMLVGQYELNDAKSKTEMALREGRIDLIQFSSSSGSTLGLKSVAALPLPCGVFDMIRLRASTEHGNSQNGAAPSHPICAAGCTDGTVKFVGREKSSEGDERLVVSKSVAMGEEMVTSLFYDQQQADPLLATTHHLGSVSVFDGNVRLSFQAHEFDAWTIAQAVEDGSDGSPPCLSRHLILTGGDDAKLKIWDLRTLASAAAAAPAAASSSTNDEAVNEKDEKNNKGVIGEECNKIVVTTMRPVGSASFGAGVVSIVPLSSKWCLVGTYDEKVHLVDLSKVADAKRRSIDAAEASISTVCVNGGAWRLRELSARNMRGDATQADDDNDEDDESEDKTPVNVAAFDRFFAVAAMQAGVRLVGLDSATGQLQLFHWAGRSTPLHNFSAKLVLESGAEKPEEPLIYDVAEMKAGESNMIVSLSFYANELKCWSG